MLSDLLNPRGASFDGERVGTPVFTSRVGATTAYLADAFFGLVNVAVSGAVDHAPHLGVHGVSLEGVHGLGAHLIIHCRVQHCTVGELCLFG